MKERLHKWLDKIGTLNFPVFQHTKTRFEDEASLNNEIVTDILENDVGMAINVIHHVNTHARGHLNHRLTTLDYAAMMLGIGKIREIALNSQSVEGLPDQLTPHILQAYGHALQSALLAREISMMRNDLVPDELYLAGLLHSLGGLSMWLLAPAGMRSVSRLLQRQCRTSDEVEYLVFGFTQNDLSYVLARKWNMPDAVSEAMQAGAASQARLRGVMMAEQLSFLIENNGDTSAVTTCLAQIALFLGREPEGVLERLYIIHNNYLKVAKQYGMPFDERLARWQGAAAVPSNSEPLDERYTICIAPRFELLTFFDGYLDGDAGQGDFSIADFLDQAVHLLHDAVGLNRVMYATVVSDTDCLQARYSAGADRDISFNLLSVDLSQNSIFKQLLDQQSPLWVTTAMWDKMSETIPSILGKINPTQSFFAYGFSIRGKPHGVFYADRRVKACQLDHHAFQRFQALVERYQLLVNQQLD
ncbi:MAG: HDOD domain-containing protein [Gammaproteobacteria bacterium]|nr:HDOD domain-containing protein [Gammaproteobacteria bacterium]